MNVKTLILKKKFEDISFLKFRFFFLRFRERLRERNKEENFHISIVKKSKIRSNQSFLFVTRERKRERERGKTIEMEDAIKQFRGITGLGSDDEAKMWLEMAEVTCRSRWDCFSTTVPRPQRLLRRRRRKRTRMKS